MNIEIGFDLTLKVQSPSAILFMLNVHPERRHDVLRGDAIQVSPGLAIVDYHDVFDNHCGRISVPADTPQVRLSNSAVVSDSGAPDPIDYHAYQHDPQHLPTAVLQFLLPSRYCEVDSDLLNLAWQQFGHTGLGATRVQAICDFVHRHLRFDYGSARANRTALEGFRERTGVCRDFAHLAITLCRAMNIPARYVTGYLGDIGVPAQRSSMDFSAWFEAYLGDRWWTFDARHNTPRIGRIVIGRGRDASDVPLTMTFGPHELLNFSVTCVECT